MAKCEFCGGEYTNVKVHQRFCKAKKNKEEVNIGPAKNEPSQEQIDLVARTLKNKKDQPDERAEQLPSDNQLKEMFRRELVIDFNEPRDGWEEKLVKILEQVNSGEVVHIKLRSQLAHEFLERPGIYRYPSDVFIELIRTYCSQWEDEVNSQGGQTFICRRK